MHRLKAYTWWVSSFSDGTAACTLFVHSSWAWPISSRVLVIRRVTGSTATLREKEEEEE